MALNKPVHQDHSVMFKVDVKALAMQGIEFVMDDRGVSLVCAYGGPPALDREWDKYARERFGDGCVDEVADSIDRICVGYALRQAIR